MTTPTPLNALRGKHLVLGVTGGVAAYKAAELARELQRAGATVQAVLTEAATHFVGTATFQALTGRPAFTDLWDPRITNGMAHIELSREADAIIVAPASADFMAKLVQGRADDLLSTLCLARNAKTCPLLVAPAMNVEMWDAPATQRNVAQLAADGAYILGPGKGDQACGETGMGRMLEPLDLVALIARAFGPQPLAGKQALVTAGPTEEPIDPVRVITNSSSGRMGYAIAEALRDTGATVTLVSGPTALADPVGITVHRVQTAAQMASAVKAQLKGQHLFFSVAAVADYTPVTPAKEKIKKKDDALTIKLAPTEDILKFVALQKSAPFCVGFAAESNDVLKFAQEKRKKKGIPVIIANHAPSAIGAADNEVTIIDDAGQHALPRGPKEHVAKAIVAHIAHLYLNTSKKK